MIQRLLRPVENRSFFLFGARGTGKTTWLKDYYKGQNYLYIDLLDDETETRFSRQPGLLHNELSQLEAENRLPKIVIIDEVQKNPKLLDIAQSWIQKKKLNFVLSGSSARKLKRGAANLLGGRANAYTLFPLSCLELGEAFQLENVLNWGCLPECMALSDDRAKHSFLRSYCQIYLKEEILVEQLVRKLPPFRNFIEILAQNNGECINLEKFSRDIGVDHKTIASYLEILEETYLGLLLRPFHPSLRKSQLQQPKFYFFDSGVKRQLDGTLGTDLIPSSSVYGRTFESWLIYEIYKINHYFELDYQMSFYRSKHGAEVDLILSKANKRVYIEIKSTDRIDTVEVEKFSNMLSDLKGKKEIFTVSRDLRAAQISDVVCLHYSEFLKKLASQSRYFRFLGKGPQVQ